MISIIFSTTMLVIVAVLLVLVALLQTPKDEGQGPIGGTGLENLVGVAQTSTFLEKITYFLATLLVVLVLLTSYLIKQRYATKEVQATVEYLEQYDKTGKLDRKSANATNKANRRSTNATNKANRRSANATNKSTKKLANTTNKSGRKSVNKISKSGKSTAKPSAKRRKKKKSSK